MTSEQQRRLKSYQDLVHEYAQVLDLSSPKMLAEFEIGIQKAVAFSKLVPDRTRVFDLGSGVGLPGIPLAILHPENPVILCEIRQKRAAFLERCVTQLKIENANVFAADAKKFSGSADIVTALWVGSLKNIYRTCQHFLDARWGIIVLKGETLESELVELRQIAQVESVDQVQLEDEAYLVRVNGVK